MPNPICEECNLQMARWSCEGEGGYSCDGCGWSVDDEKPKKEPSAVDQVEQSGATEQRNEVYALVPVEPTIEMIEAWFRAYEKAQWNENSWNSAFSIAYKAMLSVAPEPPNTD